MKNDQPESIPVLVKVGERHIDGDWFISSIGVGLFG